MNFLCADQKPKRTQVGKNLSSQKLSQSLSRKFYLKKKHFCNSSIHVIHSKNIFFSNNLLFLVFQNSTFEILLFGFREMGKHGGASGKRKNQQAEFFILIENRRCVRFFVRKGFWRKKHTEEKTHTKKHREKKKNTQKNKKQKQKTHRKTKRKKEKTHTKKET